jgi:hypothetical protein
MASGDIWFARTTVTQTTNPSWATVPGFIRRRLPEGGGEFSGVVVGSMFWPFSVEWHVEVRSDYFLDPPRMPATGDPFISLPQMIFTGGLALAGGVDETTAIGDASCFISFRQILRWDDDEVAFSDVNWNMGYVSGKRIVLGKRILAPQKRDYGALFFNLDRTRTLIVTLVTLFRFKVAFGGVIGFAPLVFGVPRWQVHSLD